ncbi:probable L-type lectin-domain containing receptor kinase S.7 [Malus domestica]|uniref:probable L-type lectin-domain containing receptor kinase S.7 n=1 Tax=Malus domestica TaxID=3750 RepID=UPI003974EFD5
MAFIFAQNTSPSPPDSYGSLLGLLDRSTQDGNHKVIDTTSITNPVVAKSLNTSGIHPKSGRDIRFTIAYDAILIACTYPLISKVVKRNHRDGEDIESQSRTTANAPEMFTYKHILVATQNFSNENLLGASAFGVVYKGILSSHPHKIVAVKKISAASKKGEREHLAEICTIGCLRHKNIVQLQGWCHEYGHHFLVYEYMPNRSLGQYIGKPYLDWRTRNSHVHCPGRLGFSAKATPKSDVCSFGMVVLEVVCGRRSKGFMDDYSIVEHVWNSYSKNALLDCVDQTLDRKFEEEQVKRTLIAGLACLHTYSMLRPKMRKVAQILMNPNGKLFKLQDTRPGPRASAVYLSVSSSAPTTEFGSRNTSYTAS